MLDESQDKKYLYKNISIELLLDPATWLLICPFLTCSVSSLCNDNNNNNNSSINGELRSSSDGSLVDRGFYQIDSNNIDLNECDKDLFSLLAKGVFALMKYGYSPLFILMYDESWLLSSIIDKFVTNDSKGNSLVCFIYLK